MAERSVYRWYASGMSLRDVAKRLDSTGVVPPRAKGWSPAAVQHLLFQRRDQYLGTFAFGRKPDDGRPEPTVTTQVEPIVDPALAAAVDEAARGRRNIGRFGSEPRLLTGLIRCGNCGSKMMVGSGPSVGRKVGYYRCPGKCGERWIRCEKVEAQVVGELEGYLRGRAFEGLLREMEEQYASRMETFRSERGLAEASLEALTRRRDNLLAALETGAVAPEDVRQRLLDLREKIESTRSTLGKMSDGPRKPVISANMLRERIITLLSSGSRRSKRAALSALLERVELKDGRPKLFLALQ